MNESHNTYSSSSQRVVTEIPIVSKRQLTFQEDPDNYYQNNFSQLPFMDLKNHQSPTWEFLKDVIYSKNFKQRPQQQEQKTIYPSKTIQNKKRQTVLNLSTDHKLKVLDSSQNVIFETPKTQNQFRRKSCYCKNCGNLNKKELSLSEFQFHDATMSRRKYLASILYKAFNTSEKRTKKDLQDAGMRRSVDQLVRIVEKRRTVLHLDLKMKSEELQLQKSNQLENENSPTLKKYDQTNISPGVRCITIQSQNYLIKQSQYLKKLVKSDSTKLMRLTQIANIDQYSKRQNLDYGLKTEMQESYFRNSNKMLYQCKSEFQSRGQNNQNAITVKPFILSTPKSTFLSKDKIEPFFFKKSVISFEFRKKLSQNMISICQDSSQQNKKQKQSAKSRNIKINKIYLTHQRNII